MYLHEFSSFLLVLWLDSFVTKLKDFQEIEMLGLQNWVSVWNFQFSFVQEIIDRHLFLRFNPCSQFLIKFHISLSLQLHITPFSYEAFLRFILQLIFWKKSLSSHMDIYHIWLVFIASEVIQNLLLRLMDLLNTNFIGHLHIIRQLLSFNFTSEVYETPKGAQSGKLVIFDLPSRGCFQRESDDSTTSKTVVLMESKKSLLFEEYLSSLLLYFLSLFEILYRTNNVVLQKFDRVNNCFAWHWLKR